MSVLGKAKKEQGGFTIVELLVVIVVIAILATITVVVYNGIQIRAKNTLNIDTVSKYYQALSLYGVENGSYPYVNTSVFYCLGSPYPETKCGARSTPLYNIGTAQDNTAFNDLIKPYMGGQLPITMKEYAKSDAGLEYIGAYYQSDAGVQPKIRYTIQAATCPSLPGAQVGRIGGDTTGSVCQVNLPTI